MRMYDLIIKKRDGNALSEEEIRYMIDGYVTGSIPDYQMSSMLMAIYFQGMTDQETWVLTDAVAHSGEMVDLSAIEGRKVDKHSTGGVGDKTTLITAPIAAACGIKVAKMSGRALGHTGGTVDKMEAIPGMKTTLGQQEFVDIVNRIGLSVIGQSGNLAPADKKLYALRDVTGTVDSIPLIAASIMSKKLAAGNDCILLDVKTGSGAFMKTMEDSIALAKKMVMIGENAGKPTAALITNMDIPLGNNIGNGLEAAEAIQVLKGEGPDDLTQVSLMLAANMLYLGGKGSMDECYGLAVGAVKSGAALNKLKEMIQAQSGDANVIQDPGLLTKADIVYEVISSSAGYISHMDAQLCGIASGILGAARETKESLIDYSAGIILKKKTGDYVKEGECLALFHTSSEKCIKDAADKFLEGIRISDTSYTPCPLVYARVTINGVEKL